MACDDHSGVCRAVLQSLRHRPACEQAIDKGAAIRIAAAERLQQLDVVRLNLVGLLVGRVSNRALLAVLDDDNLGTLLDVLLSDDVICRFRCLLIETFREVDLIARTDDDISHARKQRVVDLDVLLAAPAVRAIVDIEDDARAMFLGILDSQQACLTRRALRERRTGDNQDLAVSDVLLIDIFRRNLEVSDLVAVHQDARLRRALDLRERQAHALAVLGTRHLRRVDAALIEVIEDKVAELVVRYTADEADVLAQFVDADSHVARRTAEVHGEGLDLVQRAVQFIRIEIQRDAANQDDIAFLVFIKANECHFFILLMPSVRDRRCACVS